MVKSDEHPIKKRKKKKVNGKHKAHQKVFLYIRKYVPITILGRAAKVFFYNTKISQNKYEIKTLLNLRVRKLASR